MSGSGEAYVIAYIVFCCVCSCRHQLRLHGLAIRLPCVTACRCWRAGIDVLINRVIWAWLHGKFGLTD